ncbi:MAG: SRPBCC family protein [Oscillochloridaceae bacterium umkhey_bin13]
MIKVTRRAHIADATPEAIFEALSDPKRISQLLPRAQKVELLNRNEEQRKARLVTHMSMGGIFGTIRSEGDLTWVDNREIVFKVRTPVAVETRWQLTPAISGTEVAATMSLDLAPLLGAMAAFVPTQQVADVLTSELDATLKALSAAMDEAEAHERAVAA